MPVGVPYVEYQLPGNPEPEWINMYNALYRERMLFLCQEIEDTISNELIGLMLYLNADDPSRALFLYINSPGGSVTCGIGIYDIMRYLNSGITTICMGTAASMASFILTGGTYGRRIALPNSRIMIHQPEGGSDGQATEILSESSEVTRIRRQVGLIYANRTQQSIERIAQDLDRDQFMSAYEAREYGLIDYVARSQKEEYEPGYDLLGLNTDNFQIPAFLKKLALGPVASGVERADAFASSAESKLTASLPVLFPAVGENDAKVVEFSDDPRSLPAIAWQTDAAGNLSEGGNGGRIDGYSINSLVRDGSTKLVLPEQPAEDKRFELDGLLPLTKTTKGMKKRTRTVAKLLADVSPDGGNSKPISDNPGASLFESTFVEKLNSYANNPIAVTSDSASNAESVDSFALRDEPLSREKAAPTPEPIVGEEPVLSSGPLSE